MTYMITAITSSFRIWTILGERGRTLSDEVAYGVLFLRLSEAQNTNLHGRNLEQSIPSWNSPKR